MPLLLAFLLLLPLIVLMLMPLILIQRYRTGTVRRQAKPWAATLNLVAMAASALVFLLAAAITAAWFPGAFVNALGGMGIGALLGMLGIWVSRWESTPRALYYTPNRWLVLLVTLAVSARVIYGLWRGWSAMDAAGGDGAFMRGFGVATSLAIGGVVLGYYLAYAAGLKRRIAKWERRPLRPMNA